MIAARRIAPEQQPARRIHPEAGIRLGLGRREDPVREGAALGPAGGQAPRAGRQGGEGAVAGEIRGQQGQRVTGDEAAVEALLAVALAAETAGGEPDPEAASRLDEQVVHTVGVQVACRELDGRIAAHGQLEFGKGRPACGTGGWRCQPHGASGGGSGVGQHQREAGQQGLWMGVAAPGRPDLQAERWIAQRQAGQRLAPGQTLAAQVQVLPRAEEAARQAAAEAEAPIVR